MADVQRVAGAGVVDVIARPVGKQAVIGLVVDAFERERRPALVALGGMVVDDVENHFQAAVVEARNHLLELAQRVGDVESVARIGGEKADRIVAPIVPSAFLVPIAVVDESMHRHELDRRDAERFDVVDHRLRAQAGVRAAQFRVDLGMQLGEAFDVSLVDDRAVPGHAAAPIFAAPLEVRIDHDRLRRKGRAVALVEGEVVALGAKRVAEHRGIPGQRSGMGERIRVEQQLVWIEAMTLVGNVRPVGAKPVAGRRSDALDMPVIDFVRVFGQFEAFDFLLAVVVENADVYAGGVGGENSEIRPSLIRRRAERVRLAFAYAHLGSKRLGMSPPTERGTITRTASEGFPRDRPRAPRRRTHERFDAFSRPTPPRRQESHPKAPAFRWRCCAPAKGRRTAWQTCGSPRRGSLRPPTLRLG